MVDTARADLLTLVAELRAEAERLERCVQACKDATALLDEPSVHLVTVYGAAALIESFYTGVEKALGRVATWSGATQRGPAWHRDLLSAMALDIASVRPAVLRASTAALLAEFLAFRHRFRNLYVFDIKAPQMRLLLANVPHAWTETRADLLAFAARLESWVADPKQG